MLGRTLPQISIIYVNGEHAEALIIIISFLFLLAYSFSPSPPKFAVVSDLFKMNQLKVNFGLLRDPSFLAARMGAVTYRFVFGLIF